MVAGWRLEPKAGAMLSRRWHCAQIWGDSGGLATGWLGLCAVEAQGGLRRAYGASRSSALVAANRWLGLVGLRQGRLPTEPVLRDADCNKTADKLASQQGKQHCKKAFPESEFVHA